MCSLRRVLNANWQKQRRHQNSKQVVTGQEELTTNWLQNSFASPNQPKRWPITSDPCNFGGVPIPKVMVDGGAAINLLPHRMLSKMGRTERDLISTRLIVTNFAWGITKTPGILDVDVIVGSKKLKIAFFVVDTTSATYNALLGKDWIHQSLCVPSTLHQQLALWNEEGYMEIVEANPRPFLPSAMCFEARYYHDDLGPFTFLRVNQNGRPHGVTA
ncbi:unnamed protein product [Prunus armeniaca]